MKINRNFKKNGQASVEYMIIVGFVTFAVVTILALSFFYVGLTRDRIRLNQVESFAAQFINSAESVFFLGEPSQTVASLYLPEGVESIQIDSVTNSLIVTTRTSTGINKRSFSSRVPIQGSVSATEGVKKLSFKAKADYVLVELT